MIELQVKVPGSTYPVLIGDGLLKDISTFVASHCKSSTYVIITDETVSRLYATVVEQRLAQLGRCMTLSFPPGEANKTRGTWTDLTDRMLDAAVGRDAAVIALGGGVVGDMAGFVASTYHRGIPYVQIPTTLLAMLDSSVGGKTGVDTQHGKNLVGAFFQPKLVFADTATLRTLPDDELIAGMAEALKHGAIADAAYFDQLANDAASILARRPPALVELVRRSVAIKSDIVSEDEKEAGRRATLNFGHSVGHGVEAASGFSLLHGQSVAIGMVVEALLGEELGVTEAGTAERIRNAHEAYGLPTSLPRRSDVTSIVQAMRQDKKNRGGIMRFSPIERVGKSTRTKTGMWTIELPEPMLLSVLERCSVS